MSFQIVTLELLEAFGQNCILFAATLLGAIPLGLLIAFGSMSRFKAVRVPVRTLVWIIRGIPLMLLLFIVFYGPGLVGLTAMRSRITAALIAFIINYAAYFSEIYRGGIESIAKGQYEAGAVLGMTKTQIFFKIVLFQVVKRIIPPMGNEIITLIKDTALARVISCGEIIMRAEDYSHNGIIWPLFYTAVFFLVFVGILTVVFSRLERKMDYYN